MTRGPPRPHYPYAVSRLGARRNWLGKLVLLVRFKTRSPKYWPVPPTPIEDWEDSGETIWRDVDGNNPSEVAAVMDFLRGQGAR